jgi:hypothetical protein
MEVVERSLQKKRSGNSADMWGCSRCAWACDGDDYFYLIREFASHNCVAFPLAKILPFKPRRVQQLSAEPKQKKKSRP